jgi:hypothetical protein
MTCRFGDEAGGEGFAARFVVRETLQATSLRMGLSGRAGGCFRDGRMALGADDYFVRGLGDLES